MKSKVTIYVLLAAALIVIAKIFWQSEAPRQGPVVLKTPGTNAPKIAVPQQANVPPAVSATPADILLPPGPLPTGLTISITIQNNITNHFLRLSDPTLSVPGVGVEIREQEPGKSFLAQLAFPQGFAVPPRRQVEFRVKTSDPNVPLIRVPVTQMSPSPSVAPPEPATVPALPTGRLSPSTNRPAPRGPGAK